MATQQDADLNWSVLDARDATLHSVARSLLLIFQSILLTGR